MQQRPRIHANSGWPSGPDARDRRGAPLPDRAAANPALAALVADLKKDEAEQRAEPPAPQQNNTPWPSAPVSRWFLPAAEERGSTAPDAPRQSDFPPATDTMSMILLQERVIGAARRRVLAPDALPLLSTGTLKINFPPSPRAPAITAAAFLVARIQKEGSRIRHLVSDWSHLSRLSDEMPQDDTWSPAVTSAADLISTPPHLYANNAATLQPWEQKPRIGDPIALWAAALLPNWERVKAGATAGAHQGVQTRLSVATYGQAFTPRLPSSPATDHHPTAQDVSPNVLADFMRWRSGAEYGHATVRALPVAMLAMNSLATLPQTPENFEDYRPGPDPSVAYFIDAERELG